MILSYCYKGLQRFVFYFILVPILIVGESVRFFWKLGRNIFSAR